MTIKVHNRGGIRPGAGRKGKYPYKVMGFSIDVSIIKDIEDKAEITGQTKSEIVCQALKEYLIK